MVKKIFNFFQREFGSLHEAAFLLGSSMLLTQLLALLRDRLLASTFGTGQILDIYYASFRIPDLVYATIASFVSVTVIIPIIIGKLDRHDKAGAKKFLDSILTVFCAVIAVVSVILYFLMPYLTSLTAPGFTPEAMAELVTFSRILLLSPFLLGVSNLLGSVTQSLRKFFIYALSPLFYNIGIIIGVVALYPTFGNTGLVWGVVLGALMHIGVQLPLLIDQGFVPKFSFAIDVKEIKNLFFVSLPRTITLATGQLSIFVLVSLASLMKSGSIAIFNFSYNLQSVPLSIVGISYSVAAFPSLTKVYNRGDIKSFLAEVGNAVRHIAFWSFIFTVLFVVLRAQIVRVILGAGRFNWSDTRLTAACLALFAISVVAQSLCLLFVRGYYAAGRTLRPLAVNVISALLVILSAISLSHLYDTSLIFRYWLENLFRVDGLSGTSILILPLAFSLGSLINMVGLWVFFEKDFGSLSGKTLRGTMQSLVAALLGGAVAYQALTVFAPLFDTYTVSGIFFQGFFAGLMGIIIFICVLRLFRNED